MFVSGKIRGNAPQLGNYALTIGKNESIFILDVNGRPNANAEHLKALMHSMELNSELTRSGNSVYHTVINPDPDSQQDRAMTMDEWHEAVNTHLKNLKCSQQRTATILHELDGRMHAHIIIERYNYETGTMLDFKHNYAAHDKTRFELEKRLGHVHTPKKNTNQPKHKKTLTAIWNEAKTGTQFVKLAKANGYLIAKGTDRPFRVIDQNGRSFDLVRQLNSVNTKEVREKLKSLKLMDDKDAISQMSLLKKQKENKQQALTNKNNSLTNSNYMNWNNLINDKNMSVPEIRAKQEGKLELLKELKDNAEKALSGKELQKQLAKHEEQVKNIKAITEFEINKEVEALYNYYQINKSFSDNTPEITEDLKAKKSFEAKIQEQILEVSGQSKILNGSQLLDELHEVAKDVSKSQKDDIERQQLLKEMREARERNKSRSYER